MSVTPLSRPDRQAVWTGPAAFFQAAYDAFGHAEQAAGALERLYHIGGYTIRLRFAGPGLVKAITPALEHLAAPAASAPALTICLWDSVSTGTRMPPPPWTPEDYIARAEVRGYNEDGFRTAFLVGADTLSMLNAREDVALFWTRDGRELPYYISGAPLRTILDWWMGLRGRQLVHAAAVGTPAGGVLLVGKGGSGKSTTALACLNAGLVYAGDDYCLLGVHPVPYAHSLYSSAKLKPDGVWRFPHLQPAIRNAARIGPEKALLFLHEHCPEKIVPGFPIRAVLLPQITGRLETTLRPASPMQGLRALAPSTLFQLPGAGHAAFRTMAEFVKGVPCYHLELGTDLDGIPSVIAGLLAGA